MMNKKSGLKQKKKYDSFVEDPGKRHYTNRFFCFIPSYRQGYYQNQRPNIGCLLASKWPCHRHLFFLSIVVFCYQRVYLCKFN